MHSELSTGYAARVPELPDVTVYVERLAALTVGQPLEALRIASPFVLRTVAPSPAQVAGTRVLGVERMGKRILFAMEGDRFVVMYSIEWPGVFAGDARTIVLVGGGMKLPIAPKLRASAVALGGLDAVDRTSTMLPALAMRLGVEWSPDGSFAHAFGVSLTGMTDVIQYRDALGQQIGGATLSTAITFAFRAPARSRR